MNNRLKIYLAGSIKNVNEEFQNWRTRCLMLRQNGFYTNLEFVDPNSYFNYTNKKPKTDKQCLELFMWAIKQCDVMLVNLDQSNNSCGTCMEIEHAYCNGIPVIAFGEKPDTWYDWAETRSTVILKTLEEAIDYIHNFYWKVVR